MLRFMMLILQGIVVFAVCSYHVLANTLEPSDIVIVVLSQHDSYHAAQALDFRQNVQLQAGKMHKSPPVVRLLHEEFIHPGAWTIIPILPRLQRLDGSNSSWMVFCEERTRFDLTQLVSLLSQHDENKEIWFGHGLYDTEPSIIHHFAFAENPRHFKYPLFAAGFAMSTKLINRLAKRAKEIKSDFSIDAAHELAMFTQKPLIHLPSAFCLQNYSGCVAHPLPFRPCGKPVPKEDIYFAVKTCLKFHKDRVPIVKNTWGRHAKHIEFFSEYQDDSIPTTAVHVANTERGHCSKTFAIFKLVLQRTKDLHNLRWLVLADDDTLLSVSRLQTLLTCWKDEEVVLGERYGYNVHSNLGYNYLTGGGGIAISIALLPTIIENCQCLSDDTPDDMFLGFCLARLDIQIVHSAMFHQARPDDYSGSYLATQLPVSFHKHWMLDPVAMYEEWFAQEDNTFPLHVEL